MPGRPAADGAGGAASASRADLRAAVERYQSDRMRRTHAGLLAHPVYRPLCEFFLEDLYGIRDFGARAETFASLAHVLRPVLGRRIFEGAQDLIELQALSARLDERLARGLEALGATLPLSRPDFEAAFRQCDDRAERLRQIDLSERCTGLVHELSRHRSTPRLLSLARHLGSLRRFRALLATLERGYRALRGVEDIRPFVRAMRDGEVGYLDAVEGAGGNLVG